jgi:hypothetical protein
VTGAASSATDARRGAGPSGGPSALAAARARVAGIDGLTQVASVNFKIGAMMVPTSFRLPMRRSEFYNTEPGVVVIGQLVERIGEEIVTGTEATGYTAYRAGQKYHEVWNQGVFAPAFPPPRTSLSGWSGVTRGGDTITFDVPPYSDGQGRAGWSSPTPTILYRDGVEVGRTDGSRWATVDVPAGEAAYRLELHGKRGAPFARSTRTTAVWTFRSAHVDRANVGALPLWAVRLTPESDASGVVRTPGVHNVAISVTPQPGAVVGRLRPIIVAASFDDGSTWTPVPVGDGRLYIRPPGPLGRGWSSAEGLRVASRDRRQHRRPDHNPRLPVRRPVGDAPAPLDPYLSPGQPPRKPTERRLSVSCCRANASSDSGRN